MYVQLDGASQNKSQALFHYLGFLVHAGVFDVVRIGFLVSGHTHDIIDQFLSVISAYLRRNDVWSAQEFLRRIPFAYHSMKEALYERKKKKDMERKEAENEKENTGVESDEEEEMEEEDIEEKIDALIDEIEAVEKEKEARKIIRASRDLDVGIACQAEELEKVADWRLWLQPVTEKVEDIRDYYQFRFDKGISHDNKPCVMMRKRHLALYDRLSTDAKWPQKLR